MPGTSQMSSVGGGHVKESHQHIKCAIWIWDVQILQHIERNKSLKKIWTLYSSSGPSRYSLQVQKVRVQVMEELQNGLILQTQTQNYHESIPQSILHFVVGHMYTAWHMASKDLWFALPQKHDCWRMVVIQVIQFDTSRFSLLKTWKLLGSFQNHIYR